MKGAEEKQRLHSGCQCGGSLTPPSVLSSQQKCPRSTLTCFAEEVQVLARESERQPSNLFRKLKNIAQTLAQVIYGSGCAKQRLAILTFQDSV